MFSHLMRSLFCVVMVVVLCGAADKNSDKKVAPTSVDTGTFTIMVSGRKVASETFHVDQHTDGSVITSELKTDDPGLNNAVQNAEMTMRPNGLLKKYTWKEVTPSTSQIVIEPQDEQFMVAHVSENAGSPVKDTVHALAPGTSIMDENFYSHMEILTWKYMAFGCKPNMQGQTECKWLPLRMPVFVPHQQQSAIAEVSYKGITKMNYNGKEAEFKTFSLVLEDPSDFKPEGGNCLLWFNDQNKLVRVLIASDNMEVLRD
jgi:hypothetical protein